MSRKSAARDSKGGPVIFTATYPANFHPEENGKGYHVRFPEKIQAALAVLGKRIVVRFEDAA
jgi:hypothetical protein